MKRNVCDFFEAIEDFKVTQNVYSFVGSVQIGLRPSRAGDSVYILKIRSNDRGKGFASETLRIVCSFADDHKLDIFLEIEASDGMTERELMDWYWRFGFRGSTTEMIRHYSPDD